MILGYQKLKLEYSQSTILIVKSVKIKTNFVVFISSNYFI